MHSLLLFYSILVKEIIENSFLRVNLWSFTERLVRCMGLPKFWHLSCTKVFVKLYLGSAYGDAVRELDAAVGDILSTLVRLEIDANIKNWKKHRHWAWDSNLRPQGGRRRQNHGATVAALLIKVLMCNVFLDRHQTVRASCLLKINSFLELKWLHGCFKTIPL